jgi:hypothetical protein
MLSHRFAFVIGVCLFSCRRHSQRNQTAQSRWYVHPNEATAVALDRDHAVYGAIRFARNAVATAPWPATPFAATAQSGTQWLFATEDGTIYQSNDFLARLHVIAELPEPLLSAQTPTYHTHRGIHSFGKLFALDVHHQAYGISFDRTTRRFDLKRVIVGAFANERDVLAITEPGVLHVSNDGGEHFGVQRVPSGVALRVVVANGQAFVRTTGAFYRWTGSDLVLADRSQVRDTETDPEPTAIENVRAVAAHDVRLPVDSQRIVANTNGTLTYIDQQSLVTVDPVRSREIRREPAPGTECTVHPSGAGPRYVCRHDGWAKAVFERGTNGWITLRDEAHAQPMGAVTFDSANRAWAVSAPCTQRTENDSRYVCVYNQEGTPREMRTPFSNEVIAMHADTVLAIDTSAAPPEMPTRAVLIHNGEISEITLPLSPTDARSVHWEHETLRFWQTPAPSHRTLRLVLGEHQRNALVWQSVEAPEATTRGVHGPDGLEIAFGETAANLWQRRNNEPFRRMPSPVIGTGEVISIDPSEPVYCRGSWCRMGQQLTLSLRSNTQSLAIARTTPLQRRVEIRPREEQRRFYCRSGATTPGPEMDHGIAATGYTMRWQVSQQNLQVTWSGTTLHGAVTAGISERSNARTTARALPGAHAPAGIFEQCNEAGCDHFLATQTGVYPLSLGRAQPGGVELYERTGGGFLVRVDDKVDRTHITTLIRVSATGVELGRRDFVLAEDFADAHVGSMGSHEGLWVHDTQGSVIFYGMDAYGDTPERMVRAPGRSTPGCTTTAMSDDVSEGTLRMRERTAQVLGDGWFVEAGAWQQEELLDLRNGEFCVLAMGGGESKDEDEARAQGTIEREPVRSFEFSTARGETFVGRTWAGRQQREIVCELLQPPGENTTIQGSH